MIDISLNFLHFFPGGYLDVLERIADRKSSNICQLTESFFVAVPVGGALMAGALIGTGSLGLTDSTS